MVDFTMMDMWEESGKAHALASVSWEDVSMDSMDCDVLLTDKNNAAQTASYDGYVDQRHVLELSSTEEGIHALAITCCNPLMKTVFRDKPSYREIMCATTRLKEQIVLDVTPPNVPTAYKGKVPNTLLTMADQCQPVTFHAFTDTGVVVRYIVKLISQVDGQTLASIKLPSNCSAGEIGKPGECEACVPHASLPPGVQGLVSVTAVNTAGLSSSANVARFVNDRTNARLGHLRIDKIDLIKADKNGIKLDASIYWHDLLLGDTDQSTMRVRAQMQELAPHRNRSVSGLPRAFAIEQNRRVRRQLQSSVDRYQEQSSVTVDLSPEKRSHTFHFSLHHGPENHLSKYSIVAKVEVTSKSGRKTTRVEHNDIRLFAPFSDTDQLTDSWHEDMNFTVNTKSVAAHFRSVTSQMISRKLEQICIN